MPNTNSTHKRPQPARRVATVEEYYFSRKLREIAKLRAEGADIVSLGIGGPDQPPADEVVETLIADVSLPDAHGYQPHVGLPQLRESFAKWYARYYGVILDPNSELQPLIGSKEGVMHITLAFVNPGDGVLVPNPGYPTYTSVSRLAEARIINYDLDENNGWQPDFDALEQMDLSGVKLMWVNYPNMPTGAPASEELFRRLIDFGHRHGIVIVNDNPYSFILHERQLSILAVEGARDIAIEMNSLSKSHNMPGWRIGMVAANADFIQWILRVKSNIDSGQFRPIMRAAVKALQLPDEWYKQVNSVYARRRRIAEEIATALGCTFDPRQGGLFLWAHIPEHCASAAELADRVLYDANVFITPGFIFGSRGERYVRISLCATEENMLEALRRITSLLK